MRSAHVSNRQDDIIRGKQTNKQLKRDQCISISELFVTQTNQTRHDFIDQRSSQMNCTTKQWPDILWRGNKSENKLCWPNLHRICLSRCQRKKQKNNKQVEIQTHNENQRNCNESEWMGAQKNKQNRSNNAHALHVIPFALVRISSYSGRCLRANSRKESYYTTKESKEWIKEHNQMKNKKMKTKTKSANRNKSYIINNDRRIRSALNHSPDDVNRQFLENSEKQERLKRQNRKWLKWVNCKRKYDMQCETIIIIIISNHHNFPQQKHGKNNTICWDAKKRAIITQTQ